MYKTRGKQRFSSRRSLNLKLPKPPTLSYFMSKYSGTQKLLYCGIFIKILERDQHFDMGALVLEGAPRSHS